MNAAEAMLPEDEIVNRVATDDDAAFFFSALLQSNLYSSPRVKAIPVKTYFDGHHKLVKRLLQRPTASLLVACLKEDPSVLIGFVLSEPGVLHYMFVKSHFRRMGIARGLLRTAGIQLGTCEFTHWTHDLVQIKNRHPKMVFNPYLLMET